MFNMEVGRARGQGTGNRNPVRPLDGFTFRLSWLRFSTAPVSRGLLHERHLHFNRTHRRRMNFNYHMLICAHARKSKLMASVSVGV